MNTILLGLAGILGFVWLIYWGDEQMKKKREAREHNAISNHRSMTYHRKHGGANNGGAWRNRTWKPNPGFNDEFAGVIPGTCGQIRPGEWQCNCADKDAGCLVLKQLRSEDEPAEERTDRRGAIAAQKARKRNGS